MTLNQYTFLERPAKRVLFLFSFYYCSYSIRELQSILEGVRGFSSESDVRKAVKSLKPMVRVASEQLAGNRYLLMERLPREVLAEMAQDADEQGWWPMIKKLQNVNNPYRYYRYVPAETEEDARTKDLLARTFRAFAIDRERAVPDGVLDLRQKDERKLTRGREHLKEWLAFSRGLATLTHSVLDEEPLEPTDVRLPLFAETYCAWLNLAFAAGRDVRKTLVALGPLIDRPGLGCDETLKRNYQALCVWIGWPEGLQRELEETIWFERLTTGEFTNIGKIFAAFAAAPEKRSLASRIYDNLPLRLLAVFAGVAEKPQKPPKTVATKLLNCGFGYGDDRMDQGDSLAELYTRSVRSFSRAMGVVWRTAPSGDGELIGHSREPVGSKLAQVVLEAWDYRFVTLGRDRFRKEVANLAYQAELLAQVGYPTAARLLESLLSSEWTEEERRRVASACNGRGIQLLPKVELEPEWKTVLRLLRVAADRTVAVAERKPQAAVEIHWFVDLRDRPDGTVELKAIAPAVLPVDAPDGKIPKSTEGLYAFEGRGQYANCGTSTDAHLLSLLSHVDHWRRSGSEIFPLLTRVRHLWSCRGLDDVSRGESDLTHRKPSPITVTEGTCQLETHIREDGGVELRLPSWALFQSEPCVLVKKSPSEFQLVRIDASVREMGAAFGKFGTMGRIEVPREGVAEAAEIVERVAAVIPVAEPSADDAAALKRIPAASGCRVRLSFADDVLTIRGAVLPVPGNDALVFDPGVGCAERIVTGALAPYLLVRDLAAERANFDFVRQALAASEPWFDGAVSWRFEDLAAGIAALAELKKLGDRVPVEWAEGKKLNIVNAPKSGVALTSRRTADDWFRVEGSFALDDGRVLGIVEMIEAAKERTGNFVRLSDGDYVALSQSMARQLDALGAASRRKGDGVELVKAAVPMLERAFDAEDEAEAIELPEAIAKTAEEIRAAFARRPRAPKSLRAELRPYQEEGYRWLSRLAACGFGACLADDMGLGKTVQVISLLIERAANGASLVLAPASVCGNWRNEIRKFAPTLNPVMAMEDLSAIAAAQPNDVVIASYGYLLFHREEFRAVTWNGLVLDEAQAIKNDASKRAKTVKDLSAKFRVAATGTPVENRLGELWSLFDFLNPGLLGPSASFAQRFTDDSGKATKALKRLVKPLILRRLKGDVLDDLPEKTEVTIPVELGAAERTAYEGCRRHALAALERSAQAEGGANRMSILAELTRLRRFCCHPSLVVPEAGVPSAKMEALVDLLENLHEGGHRALVFSQFTDYLALVRKVIDARGWSHLYLDGSTPTLERERLVNAFQGGEGDFFLISLKAGGTGLNLAAANYVILLDPWWNPAVENQAADRAHRIGQKNPVTVYRLIASDTVEARVLDLHKEKKEIAEDVLDGTSSTALSPAQLMRLFG